SVDEVCNAYPEQIKSIFLNMNLAYPGLEEVKKAYTSNDIPLACTKLLEYYGKSVQVRKELPSVAKQSKAEADSILMDIFTFQNVTGKVPRIADGRLKWDCVGPENDIEWAWALNRHYPTGNLIRAYFETGNSKYVRYIDSFTKDWIISSWPYPAVKSNTAMWRGLEVSFRVKTWAKIFYELWNTNLISPATKLLILSSFPQHAHYARNFHAQGNWLTMEISGLATGATAWPEFKESPAWMDYSINTMVASMKDQIYPDGVQTELTSSYHQVALSNFSLFAEICIKNNVPLPEYYTRTLEQMWNYLALTMRPDGYGLLNNDADLINNRENILKEAAARKRSDWTYIASNGKTGTKPENGPSYIFPYAGQLISRSDFGEDAQWSFFDIGPWGSGHQHNDKLHISVAAYGRDLLVDGGRFAYRGAVADKFRKYAVGSYSHNVILADGKGQSGGPRTTDTPLSGELYSIGKDYDYGSGIFDKFNGVEGKFSHTRSMVYVRGKFWVVADQLKTDRPRNIETLWHWNPECKVENDKDGRVFTQNDRGNLEIIPVGATDWKITQVKGQENPNIQGWYSKEYNIFEPNITSVYSRKLNSDEIFVWILWPSEGKSPLIQASILSKEEQAVKVRVTEPGKGSWDILVPFMNSKNVSVKSSPKN
ncbi:MAG TPA: alginate lyase family protein, partial [Prolixibacteraceae bacterium]|nr:alginate lyase family protein [Prolixibacteraceae bacterium]